MSQGLNFKSVCYPESIRLINKTCDFFFFNPEAQMHR